MSQTKNPCQFVHIRKPNGNGSHVIATVAFIPHRDPDNGRVIGVGMGFTYRSPEDCPSYKEGRQRALKRARTAIAKNRREGFKTAALPGWISEREATFTKPVLAGVYVPWETGIIPTNLLRDIPFDSDETQTVRNALERIIST